MRQRVRQFRDASRGPTAEDLALARRFVPPAFWKLFAGQSPRDQRHAARTAAWLLNRGHDDPDLVLAALLHDIGKGHQRKRDRVAYVVAGWLRTDRRVGSPASRLELRRAIARSARHAEAGAALLEAAGAPARVVELTRLHHVPPGEDGMLALLQRADALN